MKISGLTWTITGLFGVVFPLIVTVPMLATQGEKALGPVITIHGTCIISAYLVGVLRDYLKERQIRKEK